LENLGFGNVALINADRLRDLNCGCGWTAAARARRSEVKVSIAVI